jgi:transcriptional regulator with XRE-family HTH domain
MRRRLHKRQIAFSILVLGHPQNSLISRWESGQAVPGLKNLLALLRFAETAKERAPIVDALKAEGIDEVIANLPAYQSIVGQEQSSCTREDQTDEERTSQAVRALRRRLGLTQTELGLKLSVRQNTVHRYEKGTFMPSRYVRLLLWRLAETADEFRVFSAGLEDVTQAAGMLRSDESESHA